MTEKLAAEIVKKSGIMRDTGMTSATPKPHAGEYTSARQHGGLYDSPVSRAELENTLSMVQAERGLLRERERELVEVLEKIASCHSAFDGDVVSIAYKALAKVRP